MSRKTAIPFFGNPPVEYNQRFFADLVRNFSVFVQQERASNVDHDGTGSVDEVAFFTETNVIGGSSSFTWNGTQLTVGGIIESTSGGIRFPDGTTQTTASAGGGGNVSNTGTPLDNQLAVWTNATTIEGDSNLTWDGQELVVTGNVEAEEFIGDLRGATLFKAQAGEALAKGDVVYISGISGNTTVVSKADADVPAEMPAFGVVAAAASINNPVDVYTSGILAGLNTSAFSEGDELFVSNTPGVLSNTPPTGESSQLQKLAKVTRSHASAGSIFIMGAGRTNAVPNLNTGRLFVGNSSNQAVADGTLYVDIANSRVGIGTTSPASPLTVAGVIESTSGGVKFPDGTTQTTASAGGGGNVSNTGTPANNQLAVWTNATTIEGDSNLTWDGSDMNVGGVFTVANAGGTDPNFIIQGDGEQTMRFYNTASTGSKRVSWKMANRTNTDWEFIMYTDVSGDGTESFKLQGRTSGNGLLIRDGAVKSEGQFHTVGNLGIGTTSPDVSLHIASVNPTIRLEDTNAAANAKQWNISAGNANLLRFQALNDADGGGGHFFQFERSANQITQFVGVKNATGWFTINNSDERVGIGSTSPETLLHVQGPGLGGTAGDAEDLVIIRDQSNTTAGNADRIVFSHKRLSTGTNWETAGMRIGRRVDSSEMGYIQFGHSSDTDGGLITFGDDATELMRLTPQGELGIGVSSPASKLAVAGVIESTTGGVKFPDGTTQTTASSGGGNVSNTGTPANNQIAVWTDATTIEGDADLRWTGTQLEIETGTTDRTLLQLVYDGSVATNRTFQIKSPPADNINSAFEIATSNAMSFAIDAIERFRIHDNGRIGIGTSSPSEALDVSGTVKATEMVGRIVSGSTTTGTVVLSDANKKITMTGNMTVPSGTFAQDDTILFDGNGTARTLTPASGLTIYVNGTAVTNPATVAIPANGIVGLTFRSGTVAIATGVDPEANKYYYSATSTDTTTNHNASYTPTVVDFNSQLLNQGTFTESGGRITVPVAGVYRIYGQVTFTASTFRTSLQVQIFKNGSAESGRGRGSYVRRANDVNDATAYIEDYIDCSANDILDVRAFRDGNSGTTTLNANQSRLLIEKL